MKNLIIFLLLTIPLFAQQNGKLVTTGASVYSDSLYYGVPGDSIWTRDLNFNASYLKLFFEGNTNTNGDSLDVRFGSITYKEGGTYSKPIPVDTTWGSLAGLYDSSRTVVATIVNNTVGKTLSIAEMPPYQLIQIRLLNYRGILTTREVKFTLQTYKETK